MRVVKQKLLHSYRFNQNESKYGPKITHVKYKLSDLSTKNTSDQGLICIRFASDFLWVWCEYFVCPIRKRSGVHPPSPLQKKKFFGFFSAVVKNVAALTCVAGGFAL